MLAIGYSYGFGADPSAASQCNPQTQYWDPDKGVCVNFDASTTSAGSGSNAIAASKCNPQTQFWDPDKGVCVNFPGGAAAAVTAPAAAAAAAAAPPKPSLFKKPLFWVAVIGGLAVVGTGGYFMFRRR